MQAVNSPTSQPHPRISAMKGGRLKNVDNARSLGKMSPKRVKRTDEDMAAAKTLMNLRKESTTVLRRLMREHHNNTGSAVKAILDHAIRLSAEVETTKATRASDHDKQAADNIDNQARLDAPLTLLELSGWRREEDKAAMSLLSLRRDSNSAILDAQRSQASLARLAEEKRRKEQSIALRKFREQYPAVLRTSMWRSESGLKEEDVVLQR